MNTKEWYYVDSAGADHGPVPFSEMKAAFKSNTITEESYCWYEDLVEWQKVVDVPGLLGLLKASPAPATRPPPMGGAAPAHNSSQPEAAASPQQSFAARAAAVAGIFGGTVGPRPTANANNTPSQPRAQPQPVAQSQPAAQPQTSAAPAVSARPQPSIPAANPRPQPSATGGAASAAASQIASLTAQRPLANKKLEPLGAPEPTSTGVVTQPLQIIRKDDTPDHGWKVLKTVDGMEYYYNSKTNTTTWEKPECLKSSDDYERDGEWYWIPHATKGYVSAQYRGDDPATGKAILETLDYNTVMFTKKEFSTFDRMRWLELKHLQSDLVMLDVLNQPLILYNLEQRFLKNEIYTSIGNILISINPYKRLPLYSPAVMEEYIRRGNRKLPPHVFLIADNAYKALLETGIGQSIVISGESGAGKTECTKQALQYLAEIAGSSSSNVEQKILASNPILEAFGNAKTVRNDNSSRFGKYVEIYFDHRAQISGSTNTNYLLEKIRVVKQNPNERNYHAFYQLCRGATPEQRQKYHIMDINQYHYLSQSGCDTVPDMDDAEEHEVVLKAMQELGWKQEEVEDIYRTVAGILHLGNIQFKSTGDRDCEVVNMDSLNITCRLLDLNVQQFHKAITMRVMRIAGQSDIDVPLSKEEAETSRDALAKFIYEKMFDWIVQRINLSIGKGTNAQPATIGILDIFGFEIFEHNQLEQLLINTTNEKLQLFFNDHTFKLEESLYRSEGINFAHVPYIDNTPVINTIEQRPTGIIPLIDEELRMPKGSDKTFMQKLKNAHQNNKYYKPYLKNPDCFVLEHYAGNVTYDSTGFLEKNRDQLNEDAFNVLSTSNFTFLRNLFDARNEKKVSLGTKFIKQLNDLMATLNQTEPHYIRCIKPNPVKAALTFEGGMSLAQLTYAGVFEAVTIRKQGFPFRLTHNEFFRRYKCLYKDKQWDNRVIENCKFLITSMGLSLEDVQIGTTRVLYRAEQHRVMELKRNLAVEEVTVYTQKYCRRMLTYLLKDRCVQYKPILKAAIDTRKIEEVDKALAEASSIGFPIYELKQAQRFKFVFMEEQRLERLFQVLATQDAQENYEAFKSAVESADDIELHNPPSEQIRAMFYAAKKVRDDIEAEAVKQESVLDEVQMKIIIEKADAVPNFTCDAIEKLRVLLYNTSEDHFVKLQLRAAVQLKDPELIQARTIRMKDLVLDKSGDLFKFSNTPSLYPPMSWANIKLLCWDRDELAAGMLKWTNNTIHASLTQIDLHNKEICNAAKRLFKNIQGYMGDKKQQQPIMLLVELLNECLKEPMLRDEVYCQLMKQLTANPNPDSIAKGWMMMLCCLHTFPPSTTLDNYLQMFFREHAQPPRKFINLMHKTMFDGPIQTYPTEATVTAWISSHDSLDCDDYKTKLAKAEARIRQEQELQQPSSSGGISRPAPVGGAGGAPGGMMGGLQSSFNALNLQQPPPPAGSQPPPPAAPPAMGSRMPPPPAAKPVPQGPPDHLEWYYIGADTERHGPVTKQEMKNLFKNGAIDAECFCWNETMDDWAVVSDEKVLYEYLKY